MEKGNAKNASKSSAPDTKNKQDGAGRHLRAARCKESASPRPDSRRKTGNPQKSRDLFDKRPRNRTGALCQKYRSEMMEDAMGEVSGKGGKKTNLNHLLNFTLANSHNSSEGRDTSGRSRPFYNRPRPPKYNKELFLQANCQFVARESGNYSVHKNNPDILVDWTLIEEIRLPCQEAPTCPICLYPPVAAQITRCGHVYCWPCALHYLALADRPWRKCPICFEAMHTADLKSVSLQVRDVFTVGNEITMLLMRREKGSLDVTPVCFSDSSYAASDIDKEDCVTRFQKLLLVDASGVGAIVARERQELEFAYELEKETPEACFIESALKLLDEREKNMFASSNAVDIINRDNIGKEELIPSGRKYFISGSSTESYDESFDLDKEGNNVLSKSPETVLNTHTPMEDKKNFNYFYQAEDGQHIYMHNMNVRMLLKEFGSLEFSPHRITARIVEVENVSMNEMLRKRLRYLQHLPLTCLFQVAEMDFRGSRCVSEHTIAAFAGEANDRRQNRNRKARDEKKRQKMIEIEENKKIGKYPTATYNLSSKDQFPVYNPEDFLSLSPPKEKADQLQIGQWNGDMNANVCGTSIEIGTSPPQPTTASFAQKLRDGPKTFTSMQRDLAVAKPPADHLKKREDNDSDDDFTAAPEFRQSFSDVIQAAFNAVSLGDDSVGGKQSSKKKKKAKKQLLFTTSMCRNK